MPRPYPRIGAYVGVRSGGSPLVNDDFTINAAVCQQFSRFPQVAVDMNALLISLPIVSELLRHNPEIEVAGYHLTTHWHLDASFTPSPSDKSFDAAWHMAIKNTNGFIAGAAQGYEVNWGQKATADALVAVLVDGLERLRARAYFGDYFSPMVAWAKVGNEFTDEVRVHNMSRLVQRVRAAMPADFKTYGNGTGATRCGHNGTLMEGFPLTLTTFSQAITQKDGDWLKSEGTLADKRTLRYLLGTACLTGATTSYGAQEVAPGGQPWPGTWWFDEYSVTPAGVPDATGKSVGWLGQALAPFAKLSSGLYMRGFEHGMVFVNPTATAISQPLLYPRWCRIGSTVRESLVNVPPTDALFMWGD